MKKTLAIILSILLIAGVLASCGPTTGQEDKNPGQTQEQPQEPNESNKPEESEEPEDTTPPVEEPNGPEGTLEEIIDKIYEIKNPEIPVMSMPVDMSDEGLLKFYTGLDNADKISEAVASEAMIGSQAYSMVLVRVKDSADALEIAEAMKSGIDTRKWVCVGADDLRVAASGDVVMLIMLSTAFEDTVTAAQLVDAFSQVAGSDLSVDIKG